MFGASLDLQAFLAIGSGDRCSNPISRLDVSNPMSGCALRERRRALGDADHARHRPLVAGSRRDHVGLDAAIPASTRTTSAAS